MASRSVPSQEFLEGFYHGYSEWEPAFAAELRKSLQPRGFELLFDVAASLGLPPRAQVVDVGGLRMRELAGAAEQAQPTGVRAETAALTLALSQRERGPCGSCRPGATLTGTTSTGGLHKMATRFVQAPARAALR